MNVDIMTKDYLEPIMERLSERARQAAIENFCIVHCGHAPTDGAFCNGAKQVYNCYLDSLMQAQGKLN